MKAVDTGREAESCACSYLQQHGLLLLERNYRSRRGEIDLIMNDGKYLVFVEVRYRRGSTFGSGAESVDGRKQAKISACAQYYLQQYPHAASRPCRFDVISISGAREPRKIQWIRDAFPALG